MPKPLSITLTAEVPREITAGRRFRATLIVENKSAEPADVMSVEAAMLSQARTGIRPIGSNHTAELEDEWGIQLLQEIEDQVRLAESMLRQDPNQTQSKTEDEVENETQNERTSLAGEILTAFMAFFSQGASSLTNLNTSAARRQASDHWSLHISGLQDIILAEQEIISRLPEGNVECDTIRRIFALGVAKYKTSVELADNLYERSVEGVAFQPGDVRNYEFELRFPYSFKSANEQIKFVVNYRYNSKDRQQIKTARLVSAIALLPSYTAAPIGAALGGVAGSAVRFGIYSQELLSGGFLVQCLACGIFGVLAASILARRPGAHQPLSVEGFSGGIAIGAAAGLFSVELLNKMRLLLRV